MKHRKEDPRLSRPPTDMFQEGNQCRRSHTGNARRLSEGRRTIGFQLLANLSREASDGAIIKIRGQAQGFIPPVGRDIAALAGQISLIPRIYGKLFHDLRRYSAELRPDTNETIPVEFRVGEQIER